MNLLGAAANAAAQQQHPSNNGPCIRRVGISRVCTEYGGGGGDGSIWEIVRSKALHLFLGDGDGDAEMGTSLSSSFLYGNFFALAFCCAAAAVVVVALFRSLESGRLVREAMILGACYNEDLQRTIVRLTPAAPLPPTFDQWEWNTQMASWLRLTKLDEIGLSFSQAV